MTDTITQTFELAAERVEDLTPQVYTRFFSSNPAAEQLMSHLDEGPRGKMLAEVIRLMMVADFDAEQTYLTFEVNNHRLAYSVELRMYREILVALKDEIRNILGNAWTRSMEAAWSEQIETLLIQIHQRHSN